MHDIERFITGFRTFRKDYFGSETPQFEPLKQGQSPSICGSDPARHGAPDAELLPNGAPCSPQQCRGSKVPLAAPAS